MKTVNGSGAVRQSNGRLAAWLRRIWPLPERLHELEFVRQQVPDGTMQEFRNENGELLFVVYESL